MCEAQAAGAVVVTLPKTQPWGSYTGYIADPDGFRWEIAYNPNVDGRRRRQGSRLSRLGARPGCYPGPTGGPACDKARGEPVGSC